MAISVPSSVLGFTISWMLSGQRPVSVYMASATFRIFLRSRSTRALRPLAGRPLVLTTTTAERRPMIVMTTMSSRRVKPLLRALRIRFIEKPLYGDEGNGNGYGNGWEASDTLEIQQRQHHRRNDEEHHTREQDDDDGLDHRCQPLDRV